MNETLFLQSEAYPGEFTGDIFKIETAIQACLNSEGHNRNITQIRYLDMKNFFAFFNLFKAKRVGAICISKPLKKRKHYNPNTFEWIEDLGTGKVLHTIKAFVILTDPEIKSRNIFISQSLFPFLFTQIEKLNHSPCKTISLKPTYLLCMLKHGKPIPVSIQTDLDFSSAAGIKVLAPLRFEPIIRHTPLTIEEMADGHSALNLFSLDKSASILKINPLGLNEIIDASGHFKGSTEKFAMTRLLPAVLVARRSGYDLDISEFLNWTAKLKKQNSGKKIKYMEYVNQFLIKVAR